VNKRDLWTVKFYPLFVLVIVRFCLECYGIRSLPSRPDSLAWGQVFCALHKLSCKFKMISSPLKVCWLAALTLPDGLFTASGSSPPPPDLNRDNLAGATSIVPFEGVLQSFQSPGVDSTSLLDAPGKPLSTLNAELLLSGQSLVPFDASMQVRTMHALSGLLQEFPHIAELKTVGVRFLSL
jgi:hypothetical protein